MLQGMLVLISVFITSTTTVVATAYAQEWIPLNIRDKGVQRSKVTVAGKSSRHSNRDSHKPSLEDIRRKHEHSLSYTEATPIAKFTQLVENAEKYLKIIEPVAGKINHLEDTFNEKSSRIIKLVSDIKKKINSKSFSNNFIYKFVQEVDELKDAVRKHMEKYHKTVDGSEFHSDPTLDSRLTNMENQIKNIMTGVESIVTIISEVKSRQVSRTYQKGDTVTSLESMNLINEFRKSLHDQKRKCDCKSGRVDRSERYPTDCHEIQIQGFNVSGIYKIKPDDMEPFYVLCDLTTAGGGWTVLQNRFDGSQDFYKPWNDYKNGFGNLAGEFWLGLEKFNYLTNQKLYELRIEIETQHGQEAYAGYSVFTVGPEHEGFRISTLGTYYGTAGDSLSYHAGQKFSTIDVDNDEWKDGACAVEHGGAWWYKECDKSNLNGKYSTTAEEHRGQTIYWISFKGPNFPLLKTKMMIRPLPASRPNELADASRKHLESSKLKSEKQGIRAINRKASYDPVHSLPPYKYENRGDAFFPNYK